MEVEVVRWVGKKQYELTVPSQGKELVLFVWRLDCYLLVSRLLSSALPLLVGSNKEGLREHRREGRKGRNVEAEKMVESGKQSWQEKETKKRLSKSLTEWGSGTKHATHEIRKVSQHILKGRGMKSWICLILCHCWLPITSPDITHPC